jgi:hypothetical protein
MRWLVAAVRSASEYFSARRDFNHVVSVLKSRGRRRSRLWPTPSSLFNAPCAISSSISRAIPPYKYQYRYRYLYWYLCMPRVRPRRHGAVDDHKIDRACAAQRRKSERIAFRRNVRRQREDPSVLVFRVVRTDPTRSPGWLVRRLAVATAEGNQVELQTTRSLSSSRSAHGSRMMTPWS